MGSMKTTVELGARKEFSPGSYEVLVSDEVLVFFDKPQERNSQGVAMKWLSPTQLELTYRTPRPPGFEPEYQVVRLGEIDVLVKENQSLLN